ncbi:protein TUNAR-like isoform X1 [Salvelinus fontinalis]|nr:protein TUNAR-like isoform X1 [Salvelinus fontinalis]
MCVYVWVQKSEGAQSTAGWLEGDPETGLRGKLQTFPGKMVNTAICDEETGMQDKEGTEESILAMLGIIGTILNLVVIIFVYIYTTL